MTIFRCESLLWLSLPLLAGCSSPSDRIECSIARDRAGRAIVSLESFQAATTELAKEVEELGTMLAVDPALVGLRGAMARQFAGSEAYSFSVRMNLLRSNVARQKARELALINEGDTLLGTEHDWQCKTFANSVASLDIGQSQKQLLENLGQIKGHFTRVSALLSERKGLK